MKKQDKQKLKVEKRKILGRKVKKLRSKGVLPGNIYGKKIKSQAVKVGKSDFEGVYSKAGETGVVEFLVEGEKGERNVIISDVHKDPVTGEYLHADFKQVVLTEKMEANVPIEFVGEAVAVKENKGVLLTLIDEVEVEALPTDLPESIKVDVSTLEELDQEIKVKDLKAGEKIKILTDSGLVVCKIGPFEKEEVVEKPKEEAVEEEEVKEEEKKEGEEKREEGEEKREGEKGKEESKG